MDRLAETLCEASIAIEGGLKNDSMVSKAVSVTLLRINYYRLDREEQAQLRLVSETFQSGPWDYIG